MYLIVYWSTYLFVHYSLYIFCSLHILLFIHSLIYFYFLYFLLWGFQLIVDEDVKDLIAQFQNDKLKAIEEKLEDKPTREEMEKMIQKLSEFGFAVLSARLDEVLSELKGKFGNNNIYWYTVNCFLCATTIQKCFTYTQSTQIDTIKKPYVFLATKSLYKMTPYYQILCRSSCIYRAGLNIS